MKFNQITVIQESSSFQSDSNSCDQTAGLLCLFNIFRCSGSLLTLLRFLVKASLPNNGNGSEESPTRLLLAESNTKEGRGYMAPLDTPPFYLVVKVMTSMIQVCANEVQSGLEPAEQVGRMRTEAVRGVVQVLLTTKCGDCSCSVPPLQGWCCLFHVWELLNIVSEGSVSQLINQHVMLSLFSGFSVYHVRVSVNSLPCYCRLYNLDDTKGHIGKLQ